MTTNQTDGQTQDQNIGGEGSESQEALAQVQAQTLRLMEQNQQLLSALSDPDVRRVLEFKRAGKTVQVGEPTPAPEPESEANSEPEADAASGQLDTAKLLKTITSLIDNKLAPITQQLAGVQGVADEVQKRDVASQVADAKSKYKDFGDYKEAIVKLNEEMPGLSVSDYYVLAKHRAGKLRQVEQAVQQERPTNQPKMPRVGSTGKPPELPRGRRGFNEALRASLDGLSLESLD